MDDHWQRISHIENATLQEVKDFFHKHYTPSNAVLTVAGNVSVDQVKKLAEKYFGDIPSGNKYIRNINQEPLQKEPRMMEVTAPVPLDALFKSWHISGRLDKRYYTAEIITEILGGGTSSRLFQKLVKEKQLFSSIDCSHMGSIDPGLLTISGRLLKGISPEMRRTQFLKKLIK